MVVMMILLYILLFGTCVFVHGENYTCNLCIVDSICTDDYIHFNISVSEGCIVPMNVFFNYNTDIDSKKQYSNATIDCQSCYYDLTIDPIRDAWVYTLTLESPLTTELCSSHNARCVGSTDWLVWIIIGGLSSVFILSGSILCIIRCYRTQHYIKTTQKKIETAVINS